MDFETDWYHLARQQILQQGYELAPLVLRQEDYGYQFFALRRRRPDAVPRTLHFAAGFVCPSDLEDGLELLGHDVAHGIDLRDRMVRKVADVLHDDGNLADWGIHAFELPPRFGDRTRGDRRALHACVTPHRFHCLGVHAPGDWPAALYLDTMRRDWPEAPTEPAHHAAAARREAGEMVRLVRRFEARLIERRCGIVASLARLQPPPAVPLRFRLVLCESGELGAQIEGTALTVRLA